jgi:alpha-galactosidase
VSLSRLDAGSSTLLVDCSENQFQVCYLGGLLPQDLNLSEIPLLTNALTPHGELDSEFRPQGFPTQDGYSQAQTALLARRNGQALLIDLSVVNCCSSPDVLDVQLADAQSQVAVNISIKSSASGVFSSHSTITNTSYDTSLNVDWLASIHMPLPPSHREVERYGGFWANELLCERVFLGQHSLDISSNRGRSSHQSFPCLISGEHGFSQERKQVFLTSLEWSGNHRLRIEPSPAGGHSLQAGIALQAGEVCLNPGQSWSSPPALFALSEDGVNGLRSQFRRYWYTRKGFDSTLARPVHFNSWESNYFTHDAKSSCKLMDEAQALGAERFVLDDGWMQGRVGIGCGLGDWIPCPVRYPQGLKPVAAYARKLGMSFGLWVEPEMVTFDSRVAKEHDDWVIRMPHRDSVSGRKQYLLNLCLPEVQNHILECLHRLIKDCGPDYLKWDMNRDHAQVGFGSMATPIAMTEAWYALLEEVHSHYPHITIESCAAGGGRTDAGALAHSHRIWPSDSMDPMQRFDVMKHVSSLLPPALIGTHVGASPSSTSAARLPLSTRCIVALQGHMGLELNPQELREEERSTVQRWTRFFKAERESLSHADFYYLDIDEPSLDAVLMFNASMSGGLLFVLRRGYPQNAQPPIIRLPACVSGKQFDLELLNPEDGDFVQHSSAWHEGGVWPISGDVLQLAGLRVPCLRYGHCALIKLGPWASPNTQQS